MREHKGKKSGSSENRVRLSNEEQQFLRIGIEYYIAARSAARENLITVVGVLFHHAIEMCLKARLSHQYGLQKLSQKPFGHDLEILWREFKAQFPNENLSKFDPTITSVNPFWKIRYPDQIVAEGMQIHLNWDHVPEDTGPTSPPRYKIVVTEIDHLIFRIFDICSRNFSFFTGGLNREARGALEWKNEAYTDSTKAPNPTH